MGKIRRAIGLMSGTSLDGVDVALIETDGETVARPQAFASENYDPAFRGRLRRAIDEAATLSDRNQRPGSLAAVERELTDRHAEMVRNFCRQQQLSLSNVDVVGFHGQTVLHRPETGLSVQLGDGQRLADVLGVQVVYDLRAADMMHGGQGAPLAPAYHHALVSSLGHNPVAVVNIGGVANVTWIGSGDEPLAFDTGPGNALIDDWMQERTGRAYDHDGVTASRGTVVRAVLEELMQDAYFSKPPPKSLDRQDFDWEPVRRLSTEDGAATLVAFTVETIKLSQAQMPAPPELWLVGGGGRHNPSLMLRLSDELDQPVKAIDDYGIDGDAVEAEAWAYLAVRSLDGRAVTYPLTTGVSAAMTGGVHCQPTVRPG